MKIKAFNHITGYFQEKTIDLEQENPSKWLIGRHPNCDFILNSPEVSRVHCIILYQQKQYYYIDLASVNSSGINNQTIIVNQSSLLQEDDVIRIGDFLVFLEFEQTNLEFDTDIFFNAETVIDGAKNSIQQQSQTRELTVICSYIIEETSDVKTFCFVAEPPILFNAISFNYKPGQFTILDLEIDGKQIKHPYSISSSPSRPYNLEITLKCFSAPTFQTDLANGLVSNWLYDNLKVGDKLKLSPPMGDFNYFENSYKKLLFICSDIGITPLMSMSRWLCDTNADLSVILIYSIPTQQDIIFQEELELMALRYPNFKLAINLTSKEFDLAWSGYTGRLSKTMLSEIAPDFEERVAYVCGSEGFLESVKTMLKELKFPMHNFYQENLTPSTSVKPALTMKVMGNKSVCSWECAS